MYANPIVPFNRIIQSAGYRQLIIYLNLLGRFFILEVGELLSLVFILNEIKVLSMKIGIEIMILKTITKTPN